jgi:dihydroorotate dehydrogenase
LSLVEKLGLRLLHLLDPELAHGLSLKALNGGLVPLPGPFTSPRLQTTLAGMPLANPVGLAAGFDKNATALAALSRAGFGFVEVGAATPKPQEGNPKPRLYRLSEDRAAINRFGFNNEGAEAIANRLAARRKGKVPVGLNLGANKDSPDRAQDFANVLRQCGPHVDFATVNVSSPNTEKLRDLQGRAALTALLANVMEVRELLGTPIPVFLKIAPDLTEHDLGEIAETALASGLAGIIATNTTLDRIGLKSSNSGEKGGLSGAPLFEKSTRTLARLSLLTKGKLPLIGVGGISDPLQAYAKIKAGASAVQFYTAMVYEGPSLTTRLAQGLDRLLAADGYGNVSQAVASGRDAWL